MENEKEIFDLATKFAKERPTRAVMASDIENLLSKIFGLYETKAVGQNEKSKEFCECTIHDVFTQMPWQCFRCQKLKKDYKQNG